MTNAARRPGEGFTTFPALDTGTLCGRETEALRVEYAGMKTRHRALIGERDELAVRGMNRAKAEDDQAFAESIRGGTKDPGGKYVAAANAKLRDIDRTLAGLRQAARLVEGDILTLLATRAVEYHDDAADHAAEAHETMNEHMAALQEAVATFRGFKGVVLWLDTGKKVIAGIPDVGGLTQGPAGTGAYDVGRVLSDLSTALDDWE